MQHELIMHSIKEGKLLTILMQSQLLGLSVGAPLNSRQSDHCIPIKGY